MKRFTVCLMVMLAVLLAVPAMAADRTIYNGIDLWRTVADGATFVDFSKTPIPAGFFCSKSEPFTGRMAFQGVPVATNIPGALEMTDTIVQRLDDAAFNRKGVAQTRLQVRSLNFEGMAPVKTACGDFIAKVSLDGEQPITRMRIIRENAAGGRFLAPISVNVKIEFTPVGRSTMEALVLRKSIRFPPLPNQRWESVPVQSELRGFLLVDTDGDRLPDTYLPGTSNFGVGQTRRSKNECQQMLCHIEEACTHCVC